MPFFIFFISVNSKVENIHGKSIRIFTCEDRTYLDFFPLMENLLEYSHVSNVNG